MTVGERIKQKRIEYGLSQQELAKKAGYSDKTAISKIEHSGNNVTLKQIKRIANALNVDPSEFMGWLDTYIQNAHDQRLSESLLSAYGASGFWAYHALEIGDKLPQQGVDELMSFLDYLANKYHLENISTPEEVDKSFLYSMGYREE